MIMAELEDFNFIANYAIENQLPYSITGYIDKPCDSYSPPSGYAVTKCLFVGDMSIGGIKKFKVSQITAQEIGLMNTNLIWLGVGVVVLAGVSLFALLGGKKEKKIAISRAGFRPHSSYNQDTDLERERFQF
jgi:hypothetical protein